MTETDSSIAATAPDDRDEGTSGMSLSRMVKLLAAGGIALILGLLVFALVISLTAAEAWRPVIQIFRDIFVLALVLELILVVLALAILLLQVAGFMILLKTEIKPILDHARETAKMTKTTAQFVSRNTADPLVQIKSFLAGLLTFIREMIRLRSLIHSDRVNQDEP